MSPLRRNLLRGCYLLLAVGLGLTAWPRLLAAAPQRPLEAGVVDAVLCAVQLLAVVGFLTPVRMLPLLVFEVLWKAVWLLSVAVPLWVQGGTTDGLAATAFACAWAVPVVVVVPWRTVLGSVLATTEPWVTPRGR